jgi:hypothetical protein
MGGLPGDQRSATIPQFTKLARQQIFDRTRAALSEDTKRLIISAMRTARLPTSRWRMLPEAVILGTMRGGTTSLYNYLCMHPQVRRPLHKEIEYFTTYSGFGESWYRAQFGIQWRGSSSITTESSPSYLFDPRAPARAQAVIPDGKFIVLLRNPADRAFSHYQLMASKGHETLSFADALEAEEPRVAGELERMEADPTFISLPFRRYSYMGHGMYARQLKAWFSHFDTDQFLIIRSEELYREPVKTYTRVLDFLALHPWLPAAFPTYAYDIRPAVRQLQHDQSTRDRLLQHFAEPNAQLSDLLGMKFDWT